MQFPNQRKKIFLILIIVILISIIVGFVYLYLKAPEIPVIWLECKGEVYNGQKGSNCWPWGILGRRCEDMGFPPDISNFLSVTTGEILKIETEAHKKPIKLGATIRPADFNPEESSFSQKVIELSPDFETEFEVDLSPGQYFITIFGRWEEGNISYVFKVEVK